MIRVLGIDPGGTTGLAVLDFPDVYPVGEEFGQLPPDRVLQLVLWWLRDAGHRVNLVAIEKFVVSRRSGRSSTAQAGEQARLIIGGVAQLCQQHGVRLVQRPAGVVKPWATDRRLDAAGLLAPTRGMGHARDAARHALYAAVRDLRLPDPLSTKERT
ncbi:hypothetical protein [Actinophytocola sp. NPDC049390]|uniref:hypothetical protein n=1 Tax=Actinophytocola sp. NPDC049390 TaxID=3363894 RepID=UPI0037A875A2